MNIIKLTSLIKQNICITFFSCDGIHYKNLLKILQTDKIKKLSILFSEIRDYLSFSQIISLLKNLKSITITSNLCSRHTRHVTSYNIVLSNLIFLNELFDSKNTSITELKINLPLISEELYINFVNDPQLDNYFMITNYYNTISEFIKNCISLRKLSLSKAYFYKTIKVLINMPTNKISSLQLPDDFDESDRKYKDYIYSSVTKCTEVTSFCLFLNNNHEINKNILLLIKDNRNIEKLILKFSHQHHHKDFYEDYLKIYTTLIDAIENSCIMNVIIKDSFTFYINDEDEDKSINENCMTNALIINIIKKKHDIVRIQVAPYLNSIIGVINLVFDYLEYIVK